MTVFLSSPAHTVALKHFISKRCMPHTCDVMGLDPAHYFLSYHSPISLTTFPLLSTAYYWTTNCKVFLGEAPQTSSWIWPLHPSTLRLKYDKYCYGLASLMVMSLRRSLVAITVRSRLQVKKKKKKLIACVPDSLRGLVYESGVWTLGATDTDWSYQACSTCTFHFYFLKENGLSSLLFSVWETAEKTRQTGAGKNYVIYMMWDDYVILIGVMLTLR